MDKSNRNSQMLPEGNQVSVKGSEKTLVYFASHELETFSNKQLTVAGRVLDENGQLVQDASLEAIYVT